MTKTPACDGVWGLSFCCLHSFSGIQYRTRCLRPTGWSGRGDCRYASPLFRCLAFNSMTPMLYRPMSNGHRIVPRGLHSCLRQHGRYLVCFCCLIRDDSISCQIVHTDRGQVMDFCHSVSSVCGFRRKLFYLVYFTSNTELRVVNLFAKIQNCST